MTWRPFLYRFRDLGVFHLWYITSRVSQSSVAYPSIMRSEWRDLQEDFIVWNSPTSDHIISTYSILIVIQSYDPTYQQARIENRLSLCLGKREYCFLCAPKCLCFLSPHLSPPCHKYISSPFNYEIYSPFSRGEDLNFHAFTVPNLKSRTWMIFRLFYDVWFWLPLVLWPVI